jgi:hypothetical protein
MRPISLRNAFHCPRIGVLRVGFAGKGAPDRNRPYQPRVKSVEQPPGRKGVAGQRSVADRQPAPPAEGDPTRVRRAISCPTPGLEFASAEQVGDVASRERSGDEISGQRSRLRPRQVGVGVKSQNAATVRKVGCVRPTVRLRSRGTKSPPIAADAMRPPAESGGQLCGGDGPVRAPGARPGRRRRRRIAL